MKVEGPNKGGQKVSKQNKTGKKDSTAFDALVKQSADTQVAHSAQQVEGVDATQTTDDSLSGKSPEYQEKHHAEKLLDQLEKLHIGLISGGVSTKTLNNITRMVQRQKQTIQDEELLAILNEIDLRAQVELAKFNQK